MKHVTSNHHWRYALVGALLGLGAPFGALVLHLMLGHPGMMLSRIMEEWVGASYYYVYMALGSVFVFTLFGFVLGKKNDRLEEENRRATALAVTDGLTGLYNHRYLQQQLTAEFERARRYATPLTCLMLDLDDFKAVNDTYGHPFGDDVLRTAARVIREHVRRVDTAGRYGGEEFLVLMPHTVAAEAMPVAERIRAELQEFPFRCDSRNVRVTISIGVATYPGTPESPMTKNDVLKLADEALYTAKRNGKNQVRLGTPS